MYNGKSNHVMIRFSIIIPLYNKVDYIERALNSVINQTYKHFDIIVVNDGSKDGSLELVYAKFKESVILINQENLGVSAARNNGVAKATGDYICFLDADDEWKPFFLAEIYSLIQSFPRHFIFSVRHEMVTEEGFCIQPKSSLPKNFTGSVDNMIDAYRASSCILSASSVCVEKQFFNQLGGFPVSKHHGEDVYLWLLYGMHTELAYSDKIGCCYYKNASSNSYDSIAKDVLPYHFSYYLSALKQPVVNENIARNKSSLIKFMLKDALLHIAYLKSQKKHRLAFNHARLLYAQNKAIGGLCLLVTLFPRFIINATKTYRNGLRSD